MPIIADVAERRRGTPAPYCRMWSAVESGCGLPVRSDQRPISRVPSMWMSALRDVQIFGGELAEELPRASGRNALMQIVDVTVARIPAARRQIDQPSSCIVDVDAPPAGTFTIVDAGWYSQPRIASMRAAPAGTSSSNSPSCGSSGVSVTAIDAVEAAVGRVVPLVGSRSEVDARRRRPAVAVRATRTSHPAGRRGRLARP